MPAELFNITAVQQLGQQELLLQAHQASGIPSAVIIFVITILALLIAGASQEKARKSETFWGVFFFVLIVGVIALTWIILSPNSVRLVVDFFVPRG